jgi:hypothetical protein
MVISPTVGLIAFFVVRNVVNGLDYQDPSVSAVLGVDLSNDAGVTWTPFDSGTSFSGGIVLAPSGGIVAFVSKHAGPVSGTDTLARARVTASGLRNPLPLGLYGMLAAWEPGSLPGTVGFPFDAYALPPDAP